MKPKDCDERDKDECVATKRPDGKGDCVLTPAP
jgi:hypothetical protein